MPHFNILSLSPMKPECSLDPSTVFENDQPSVPASLVPVPPKVLDFAVLTAMPALRHLDVSHNLLCRMEPMDGRDLPSGLETLNMSHNRVSRIGGIGQCFAIRIIDLSHNRIKV